MGRYSKSFRVFTGFLGFAAGMANFGIIPVVGARFMTYFLGLPQTLSFNGCEMPTHIPLIAHGDLRRRRHAPPLLGSLFIQDVIVPLRKKPFTPVGHIRLLRWSMVGVALFAFGFGCLFKQTEYVMMWWVVTEALYVGGAGVAIIGGLYWKKGTSAGAWAGLLSGSGLVTSGILARQIWGDGFPLNGAQISFFGSISACLIYAVVSLLTCRKDFDMDRMLHRGIYAVESEKRFQTQSKGRVTWGKLIGLDKNFTFGDKLLAGGLFGWSMIWFGVFVGGSIWNLVSPWPVRAWSNFWYVVGIGIPVFFAFVTAIWFAWGGIRDMRLFFRRLKEERVDALDNGMVVDHRSLGEER